MKHIKKKKNESDLKGLGMRIHSSFTGNYYDWRITRLLIMKTKVNRLWKMCLTTIPSRTWKKHISVVNSNSETLPLPDRLGQRNENKPEDLLKQREKKRRRYFKVNWKPTHNIIWIHRSNRSCLRSLEKEEKFYLNIGEYNKIYLHLTLRRLTNSWWPPRTANPCD